LTPIMTERRRGGVSLWPVCHNKMSRLGQRSRAPHDALALPH
jgi:hypothetical protein